MTIRNSILHAATIVLLTAIPLCAYGQGEEVRCYKDQYVITVNDDAPLLQGKAVEALEEVSSAPLSIQESSQHAILVAPEGQSSADGRKTVRYRSLSDLCEKMKSGARSKLRRARDEGRSAWVRRFSCSCNAEVHATRTPNDPYWYLLWGMNQSSDLDINMPQAWDMCTGSSTTVAAIIDSGLDYNHPDLAANSWVNPGEIAGNGIDDDGNGFIDDIHGANMITNSGDPMDDNGHGTHVAGTIGAAGNNGVGVVGVNWQIKMIGVKFLASNGSGGLYDAIKAVDYVTNLKNRGVNISVVNNSWGGGGYMQPLSDAITRSQQAGIVFVVAAGNNTNNNDANPTYPANYPQANIISVAAVDSAGAKASFSNYGQNTVHIGAPGVQIGSTYPNNQYVYQQGTSMAAPHVTGAIALLKSYAQGMTWSELKDTILRSARPIPGLAGFVSTGALLDVNAALQDALSNGKVGPTPTPQPTATPTRTPTPIPTATRTPTPTPTPTTAPGYFNLSGRVTGGSTNIANAKVVLQFGSTKVVTYTNQNGDYFFNNIYGPVNYSITVTKGGLSFTTYSSTLTSHSTINLSGAWKQYTLGVTVLDLEGRPVPGVWINGGALGSGETDAQGRRTFTALYGTNYLLAPAKLGQSFRVDELTGTVLGDVDRVVVATPEE